jgi:Co/Zn/Cd efflux system component
MLARFIVNKGVHESWVLVVAFAGLIATTYFRGRSLDATAR